MRANASATVICNQQIDRPFYFYQLLQVHVSGITFIGCRMDLRYLTNATFERNSFMNWTRCCYSGAALYIWFSSVQIIQCIISNNSVYNGAVYGYSSNFLFKQVIFSNNHFPYSCCGNRHGGAIYLENSGNMDIHNSNFSSNSAFNGHGGAIYFDGGNITVTNSTFINNTASAGGGGAIYSARRYTNISLINNIFSHNIAAYCGVIDVDEFYHHYVSITENTFIYNKAVGQVSGNNGGGVICIRNASFLVLDNYFSHNSAAGDGGVIQVDESNIIIERSTFKNNTAEENGGVLYTYAYPTRYTIINSIFTNNQAGGDGGVMYVGRAGSHVTVNQSTFGFNNATNRGGVIAIIGSTLGMNGANIFENTAELGEVISACNSDVTITNPEIPVSPDPIYSFCTLYNSSNTTASQTTEQTTPTTGIISTAPSTTTERDTLTTTTPPPTTDDVTSTEEISTIIETTEEATTTAEDITDVTTTVSTTEDINIVTTTATEPLQSTTTTASTTVMEEMTSTVALTEEVPTTTEDTVNATATVSTIETSTPEPLQGTTTTASTTVIEDSETTTIENINTTTTSSSQEITTTDEDSITTTYEEVSTTGESVPTTTFSQFIPPMTTTKPESSTAIPVTTRTAVSPVDGDQDKADHNLHYILPGYVAIGACAVLIVFIGLFVIVKVFRRKHKSQNMNLSAYDYPAIKNEYSLPDVHVAHS